MKRDGVYRFNLQFPADTQEHIRVGEVLERGWENGKAAW